MVQDMVLVGAVQRKPYLQLVSLVLQGEWVSSVDPTFPFLERWPPGHPLQALYCPMGVPIYLEGDFWGVHVFGIALSWVRSSKSWCSSWSSRSPSSTWRWCSVPLLGGVYWGGVCSSFSPFEGFLCDITIYASIWASEGAMALTVMASPQNSSIFVILWVVCCSSSKEWNKTTDPIVEYRSTPKGWVWPYLTQILMMSSSEIKEASIGVSSFLVINTRHNLSPKMTSADGTSNFQRQLQRRLWTF